MRWLAAAQAEREKALHEAEEALKQAADAQRKRARIRNIALVVVSILALVAGLLALYSDGSRRDCPFHSSPLGFLRHCALFATVVAQVMRGTT
jgi:hypothetical protein